jgi:phage baseplate assembly protein W
MSDSPIIIKNVFSDLPMFLTKNSFTNDLNVTKDLSSIKNSVKNIVLTNIGERAFDYEFGGNIHALLFENVNDVYFMSGVRIRLANMINKYDTRVKVDKIIFESVNNIININIEYSIFSLNTKDKITIKLERSR